MNQMPSTISIFTRFTVVTVLSAGLPAAHQTGSAAQGERRVASASCDAVGAHVTYDSGPEYVHKAGAKETCADIRVSDDRRAVAWVMTSEATAEDDRGNVLQRWQRSRLFVNGVEVAHDNPALYEWRFHDGGRQVVFEAGALHGGGNVFLYDVEKKQIIEECLKRQAGTACAAWAAAPANRQIPVRWDWIVVSTPDSVGPFRGNEPGFRAPVPKESLPATVLAGSDGNIAGIFEVIVTVEGVVEWERALAGSNPAVNTIARQTLSRWRFVPAWLDGKAVRVRLRVFLESGEAGTR